jgi:putative tricarboxylic transport membrane protein
MDVIHGLMLGFSVACTLSNLFWAFLGAWIGTFVGVMPGLGTTATVAILLPITVGMSPASGLILMTAIYCGAK